MRFARLDASGREGFFEFLRNDLGADPTALDAALERYRASPDPETAAALAAAAEPRRQELLRLMNTAPDGTRDIVAMRVALLEALSGSPELKLVDDDFVHVFRSWFNRGFLELHRIDWRTPAIVLEKIIQYEAVHQVLDWDDQRRRLQADRRCFGFFHPSLPDEPLIFVEVACARGWPARSRTCCSGRWNRRSRRIPHLLLHQQLPAGCSPGSPSATSHQAGGAGAGGGDSEAAPVRHPLLPDPGSANADPRAAGGRLPAGPDGGEIRLDGIETADWPADTAPGEHARASLTRLCAHYLLRAKRGMHPFDPVAGFTCATEPGSIGSTG